MRHGSVGRVMRLARADQEMLFQTLVRISVPWITMDDQLRCWHEYWRVNASLLSDTPRQQPIRVYYVGTEEGTREEAWRVPVPIVMTQTTLQTWLQQRATCVEMRVQGMIWQSTQNVASLRVLAQFLAMADNWLHLVVRDC